MKTIDITEPILDQSISQELIDTLTELSRIFADKMERPIQGESMLVGRILDGLNQDAWLELVERHNLNSWIGIPLSSSGAASVEALQDTIEKLIFQRDHDPLTGLANKRYFERFINMEMERARRTGTYLGIISLDLDDFKHVNDTYGHPCGDLVLATLGKFLREHQRVYDLNSRVGGEEFAILLPNTPCWESSLIAERILQGFREISFEYEDYPPFSMTFSAGVGGVGPTTGYISAVDLVKQADEALYIAKQNGKNRIVVADNHKFCTTLLPHPKEADKSNNCLVRPEEKKLLFTGSE